MSKKAKIDLIDRLWWALSQRCDRVKFVNAQWKWTELNETTRRQEKEHMAFGAHLLKHTPPRSTGLQTRARYFAVKTVLQALPCPVTWTDVDMRSDWVQGAILRTYLDQQTPYWWFAITPADWFAFERLDYAKDLA